MEIELKRPWLGRPPGTILNLEDNTARRLIEWKTAKLVEEKKKKDES